LCKLLSGLASDSARLRIRLQLAQRQRSNYTGDTFKMEGSPLKHVTASDINRAESEKPLAHAAESGNLMAHTTESGNLLPMRQSPETSDPCGRVRKPHGPCGRVRETSGTCALQFQHCVHTRMRQFARNDEENCPHHMYTCKDPVWIKG